MYLSDEKLRKISVDEGSGFDLFACFEFSMYTNVINFNNVVQTD